MTASQPLAPTADSASPRAGTRALVPIPCEVRQGTRAWQRVMLEDLSQHGFRLTGLTHPAQDKPVSIRIPGMQLLSARIRWIAGTEIGCEFAHPLHVVVFDHLVRVARPFG